MTNRPSLHPDLFENRRAAEEDSAAQSSRPYNRYKAEKRFARVYETVEGDTCTYCGIPNDGQHDHQPPVYILHRFSKGALVTKRAIREAFGQCKLVPCCTICNMGLGAYHGSDDNDRRGRIANWFLLDDRFPEDQTILDLGYKLAEERIHQKRGAEVYGFPGVGRAVYIEALTGFIDGAFASPNEFPSWLKLLQSELAVWLRQSPKLKSQYFLAMANLASYKLLPHAWSDPCGQFS